MQAIGEITRQTADIVRTEGAIAGEKAKTDPAKRREAQHQLEDEAKQKGQTFDGNAQAIADRAALNAQRSTGTGSSMQAGITAAGSVIMGLAGGDWRIALADGASPYLAQQIHAMTMNKDGNMDTAANLTAHAIVNAALAIAKGGNALNAATQASGAVSGEAMAMIATNLYNKKPNELTETEKQTVSALSTLAGGLAGGLVGGNSNSAATGAMAGKTTADFNYLSSQDIKNFTENYAKAKTDAEKEALMAGLKKLDVEQQKQALSTGISINDQKEVLTDLKTLAASPGCTAKCQELAAYSISELEPVTNNMQLHEDNLKKGILASVIYALTIEKPISGSSGSGLSSLTKEQQQLIRNAETITTAKGIQNPFPRDINEKILWNGVKANPSAGYPLTGLNSDPKFPSSAGFQKMSVNHTLPDGRNIEIHYQYNSNTGKAYDMKIITPQRLGASFKEKQ